MRTTLLFASRFASDTACGEIAIFRQRSVISDSMLYYRGVTEIARVKFVRTIAFDVAVAGKIIDAYDAMPLGHQARDDHLR